ncbi:hypothetical protein DHW03_01625 [Pedobacter yonginense]|uniref:OmpA-like domain-containing protein n=2 Tax=Pedobacter yonginense TaxID=651869 RepID=A0A317ERT7_9SPHI|nr:hypothetical protein DHW03_01625 [Pedobacter yonginense]
MTSLFVVMLVMFIISYISFRKQNQELAASKIEMDRIRQIDKALRQLDKKYFYLDPDNNRYKLLVEVIFKPHSADINTIGKKSLQELENAGAVLYKKMKQLSTDKDINYLLIVEGNTERYNNNWMVNPDLGYLTSYKRSLALKKFWQSKGFDFSVFQNCEILIVGSGYFGRSHQKNSRTFTIQITPKFKIGQ